MRVEQVNHRVICRFQAVNMGSPLFGAGIYPHRGRGGANEGFATRITLGYWCPNPVRACLNTNLDWARSESDQ